MFASTITEITTAISPSSLPNSTIQASNITPSCHRLPDYTLALTGTSCCLSILGAIVIFITYAAIPEIRNVPRKLLIWLTLADLLTSGGNLLGTIRYDYVKSEPCGTRHQHGVAMEVCVVQSFITTFSSMSSFLWTLAIAVHIFCTVVLESAWIRSPHMMRLYHVICWVVPVSITVTAAFKGYLGEDHSVSTGSWCWIRSSLPKHTQMTWMLLSGKGWEMSCYILTASLYIILKLKVWRQRRRRSMSYYEGLRDEDRNYLYVGLVLYLIRIWGTIRFWIAYTRPDGNHSNHHLNTAQFVLLNFQGVGDSSQAFFNCIIFCVMDTTIRRKVCHQNEAETRPLIASINNERSQPNVIT